MNRRNFLQASFATSALARTLSVFAADANHSLSPKLFLARAPGAAPHCYWPWMNGNISRQGITLDLEAMHRMGIRGAYVLDNALGIPRGSVDYGSPRWIELLRHAAQEAHRLGIALFIHNGPGYSGTGGPWVKPAESQQQLVWTETRVGAGRVNKQLSRPYAKLGAYADICVLAYPTPDTGPLFHNLVRAVQANAADIHRDVIVGPDPARSVRIEPQGNAPAELLIELDAPFTARAITIYRLPEAPIDPFDGPRDYPPLFTLEASQDGQHYTAVCTIAMPALRALEAPGVASFAPVRARFFRLTSRTPSWISGIDIHDTPRLPDWAVKANGAAGSIPAPATPDAELRAIDPDSVIELSKFMDGSGRLRWSAPAGRWTIVRFGHTATGQELAAAPESAQGLSIDMFAKQGVDIHFERFLDPLFDALGPLAGPALQGILADSFEEGRQNWSPVFPEAFERKAGYALGPWLLTMSGRIVGDIDQTEKALFDVRRVQAELMAENYLGHMRNRCAARGLQLHAEPYGDGAFDSLQSGARADVALGEFWVRATYGRDPYLQLATSIAHARGLTLVPAEAFTGEPRTSRWKEHPYAMTAQLHRMSTLGVSRLVLHAFVHQPHPTAVPGMTMGPFGTHFDRNCGWAEEFASWTDYAASCHSILQQGTPVVDIACFKGEEIANNLPEMRAPPYEVPFGYASDMIDAAGLLALHAVDGQAVNGAGLRYRCVMLPPLTVASVPLMEKLVALAGAGIPIFGSELPRRAAGGPQDRTADVEVRALAGQLSNLPRFIADRPTATALRSLDIEPDFVFSGERPDAALSYTHRRIHERDVYFVCNEQRRRERVTASFRINRQRPVLWDPERPGYQPAIVTAAENRTELFLDLPPSGALFVVFGESAEAPWISMVSRDAIPLVPMKRYPRPIRSPHPDLVGNFTISAWIKPETIALPGRGYIAFPDRGTVAYGKGHAVCGLAAGANGVFVYERSDEQAAAIFRHEAALSGWVHVALVYRDRKPDLFVNGLHVASGPLSRDQVHPGLDMPAGLEQIRTRFEGEIAGLTLDRRPIPETEIAGRFGAGLPLPDSVPDVTFDLADSGSARALFRRNGSYRLACRGKPIRAEISGVQSQVLAGPWELRFEPGRGAPASIALPALMSLHAHENFGVRHFSGRVTYRKAFKLGPIGSDQRLLLDLGRVEVTARVLMNGRDLGCVWKPPYEIDVSSAAREGDNVIEITVVSLWPNRMIGDEHLPPEAQYAAAGNILALPAWYSEGASKAPTGRITFSAWKHFRADDPLLAAGLLGPVRVTTAVIRSVSAETTTSNCC